MISVQQQLHRQWLITLLIILLPLLVLADYGVRRMTTHYILDRLGHDADSLISAMTEDDQGRWQVDEQRLGSLYQRVYSGHYYAVHGDGTDLHSRSLWDHNVPDMQLAPGNSRYWQQAGVNHGNHQETWLILAEGIRISDHTFTLWVAEDISPLMSLLQRYRMIALALLAGSMILLLIVQRRQLRKAFARLQPLQQLQTLIQRELKRARIVGLSSPGRQTRLADELPPLMQVLNQLYPGVSIHCAYEAEAVMPQDRDDVLELLGNLLDNACKYGGGEVTLTVEQQPQQWQIEVTDNGPGIAAEDRERLLRRGARLDEQGEDGSGLGLAIVSDIVTSYQGTLALQPHQPQGLRVVVTLPAGG